MVREVDLDAGPAADLQRLGDAAASECAIGVDVPEVGHVHAAGLPDDLAQRHDLARIAPGVRMIGESRGQARGALFHPFRDQSPGPVQQIALERNVAESSDLQAHGSVGDQIGGVHAHAIVMGAKCRHGAHVEVQGRLAEDAGQIARVRGVVVRGQRRVREPVLPQDLGRDALTQARGVLRIGEQDGVGVDVRVYEARRDGESGGLYRPSGVGCGEIADSLYALPGYSNVGVAAGTAGAVDDRAAANH